MNRACTNIAGRCTNPTLTGALGTAARSLLRTSTRAYRNHRGSTNHELEPMLLWGVALSDNGRISDSLSLTLRTKGDTVVGRLNWRPQEKDRLQGRILGAVTGDSIHAVLTYRAEGEEAKEERSFVIEKGNLVELKVRAIL